MLGIGIGNGKRLDRQLLLRLQRLQPGRRLVHVGIDETAHPLVKLGHGLLHELRLHPDAHLQRPKHRRARDDFAGRSVDVGDVLA